MRKKTITGKYTAIKFSWIFIACSLLISTNTLGEAASKNFYFPEVRSEVNVYQDGSFTVDEYRTYGFQGSFSWATM